MFAWTEENVELLRKRWTVDGYSAAQIAAELRGGLTRNAVIGKIKRLGLVGQGNPSRRTYIYHKRAPKLRGIITSTVNATSINNALAKRMAPIEPKPRKPDPTEPLSLGIGLMDLGRQHCRWVDQLGTFCGHERKGTSYCDYHSAVVYRNPEKVT